METSSFKDLAAGVTLILTGRDRSINILKHELFQTTWIVDDGLIKTLKFSEGDKGPQANAINKGQESVPFKLGPFHRNILYVCANI